MRSLSSAALAALRSGHVAVVQLLHINFSGGVVALNTSNWDFDWEGVTYKGAYGLGSIGPIEDSAGEVKGVRFELAAGSPGQLALALDDSDQVQGAAVVIRTALIETTGYTVVDAPKEWSGVCDTMTIVEDAETAVVNVTAESRAVDLLRGSQFLYTDGDQQNLVPGDRAFEYVVSQEGKPVVWPTREFFYQ